MNNLFNGCGSLTSIDLSNFNTENVKSMSGMFYGCEKLQYLDISSFKSSTNENIIMFKNLPKNGQLKVSEDFIDKIKEQIPANWTIN